MSWFESLRRPARAAAFATAALVVLGAPAGAAPPEEPAPPAGRAPLVDVPVGCPTVDLSNNVVFVGTVTDTDYRTARFRIVQPRSGDLGPLASQVGDQYLIDVRYGVDAKYLHEGRQYLVGASVNLNNGEGLLGSKVAPVLDPIGDDEVIGASETDRVCPTVNDPNMTVLIDGRAVDAGMLTPFFEDRTGILRAILLPVVVALGGILALAALRAVISGLGRRAGRVGTRRPSPRPPQQPPPQQRPRPAR